MVDSAKTKLDEEIFSFINDVRKDPKFIVPKLEAMLAKFEGEVFKRENKPNLRTREGIKAVEEAVKYCKDAQPQAAFTWRKELSQASKDHVEDIGPKGQMKHEGSDGITVKQRLEKYGKFITSYGENLSFACDTAEEVVLQLIIDDGVLERGHRENIFNPDFKVFGCFSGSHKDYTNMTCMNFAGGFVEKGQEDPIEKQMDAFLKEEVEIEMPTGVRSWKQNSKVSVSGNKATKTVTRVCKMDDGTDKTLTKTVAKEFTI